MALQTYQYPVKDKNGNIIKYETRTADTSTSQGRAQISTYTNEAAYSSGSMNKEDFKKAQADLGYGSNLAPTYQTPKTYGRADRPQNNQSIYFQENVRPATTPTKTPQYNFGGQLGGQNQVILQPETETTNATTNLSDEERRANELANRLKKEREAYGKVVRSESLSDSMNTPLTASFGVGDTSPSPEQTAEDITNQVKSEMEKNFNTQKQRDLLMKQLGIDKTQEELFAEGEKKIQTEADKQIAEIEEKKARAAQSATAMYFGGANAGQSTTTGGLIADTAQRYDKLISDIRTATQDDLENFRNDLSKNYASAQSVLMDFDNQQQQAVLQEVNARIAEKRTVQQQLKESGMGYIDSLIESGQFTEISPESLLQFSQQFGLDIGQISAIQLMEKQKQTLSKGASISEIAQRVEEGTATIEEATKFQQYQNILIQQQDQIMKMNEPSAEQKKMTEYANFVSQFADNPEMIAMANQFYGVNELDNDLPASVQEFQYWNNLEEGTAKDAFARKVGLNDATISYLTARTSVMSGGGEYSITAGTSGTRADRNNNPGNLRAGGKTDDGGFTIFNTPEEGFQAMIKDLTAKMTGNSSAAVSKLGRNAQTLREMISVYAPSEDNNDPNNYSNVVARKLGVSPDEPLSNLINRIPELAKAMAEHEGFKGAIKIGATATSNLPPDVQLIVDTAEDISSVSKQLKDAGLESYTREAGAAFNAKTKQKLDFSNSKEFREARSTVEKLMGGTRMSDAENDKLRDDIQFIMSNGGGFNEALDFATGVRVQNEEDKPITRGLRRAIFGTGEGTAAEKTEIMSLLSQDVANGNRDYAVQEAERIALEKKAKLKADDQYKADKLVGLIDETINLAKENPKLVGFWDGRTFNITKGVKGDYEKQRLAYLLTEIYATKRNEIAGTAITNSEMSFLEDLVGTIADPEQNFLAKLEGAKSTAIKERNSARSKAGLATVEGRFPTDEEKIAHFEKLGGVYGGQDDELSQLDREFEQMNANSSANLDQILFDLQ